MENAGKVGMAILTIFIALAVGANLLPTANTNANSFGLEEKCGSVGCFYNSSTDFCAETAGNGSECDAPIQYNATVDSVFSIGMTIVMVGVFLIILAFIGIRALKRR